MNRSILIVICDFLLVSLLAFSTVDNTGKLSDKAGKLQMQTGVATNRVEARQDLGSAMQLALAEERKSRDQLLGELTKMRDASVRQQTTLSEREKQVQSYQQQLQTHQQEEQQLQNQQAALQKQFAAAQTNIQTLNQKLLNASNENVLSKESIAATEAEARRQAEDATALRRKLEQLNKDSQQMAAEKQKLASELQVAEAEKRSAAELAKRMEEEVKVEREEKAKLAEGVKVLANKSGELVQEIRENRPLAPNTIFQDFISNRVEARFEATRSTLFGIDSDRRRDTQTILVGDGTNLFALCHVQDTPLTLWSPGTEWEGLTGNLNRNATSVSIHSLSFYMLDPRVVLMPVSAADARALGGKIYRLSSDPFKFQDAVVVGTRESYYGEVKFELDVSTPQYVKMDRNSLKGLFGKFNPSRGDLVFSRNGDLLGVMANGTYCMLIHNFDADPTIRFGPDVRAQHTGSTLSMLASTVMQKPFKLQ
ncbi:MAG TPA: hypothetical protein VG754_13810 [Verrucomicrobiae bacterium]|nr:hypothetical protein [Verrucomicrobiae bacterium]